MWMFLDSKSICRLCGKLSVPCRMQWQVYHGSFLVSRLLRFPFQVTGVVLGFLLHTLMMIFESQGEMVVFLCSPKKGVPFLISSKIHVAMSYLWKEYTYLHLFPLLFTFAWIEGGKTVILLPFFISMVGSFKKKNGKDCFPPGYCVPFRLLRGWSRRNRNHCNLTRLLDPNIWHFCHLGVRLVNTTITMSV